MLVVEGAFGGPVLGVTGTDDDKDEIGFACEGDVCITEGVTVVASRVVVLVVDDVTINDLVDGACDFENAVERYVGDEGT